MSKGICDAPAHAAPALKTGCAGRQGGDDERGSSNSLATIPGDAQRPNAQDL